LLDVTEFTAADLTRWHGDLLPVRLGRHGRLLI